MLKHYTARTARAAIAMALGGAALLAACDQIDTRIERAREIADASVDQINGETVIDPTYRNLERAAPADRALAGTVIAQFAVDDEERPMFAIGSIIAKPLDIPASGPVEIPDDAAMIEEELEYFDSPEGEAMLEAGEPPAAAPAPPAAEAPVTREIFAEPAQVMPRIKLDPRAAQESRQEIAEAGRNIEQFALKDDTQRLQMRRLSQDDLKAMAPEERVEVRKIARRAPVAREVVQKQLDANAVMLDTMTRYGVGGEVALSRQETSATASRLHGLRRFLDPVAHDPYPSHPSLGGASLAFRRKTYEALGGFPAISTGEDTALVAEARLQGWRVRHDRSVHVLTSARTLGRAQAGLSCELAAFPATAEAILVPDPDAAVIHYQWHNWLRRQVMGVGPLTLPAEFNLAISPARLSELRKAAPNSDAFVEAVIFETYKLPELSLDRAEQRLAQLEAALLPKAEAA